MSKYNVVKENGWKSAGIALWQAAYMMFFCGVCPFLAVQALRWFCERR